METEDANNPLRRRLKRALDLRLGENEDLVNGLLTLDSNDEIITGLLKEILENKGQNICRSLQFSTYKYQILTAERLVESLKPFIDDLKTLNTGFRNSEKLFNETIICQINSWSKYTFPLLEEFRRIENEIAIVETKRNMCNTLLSGLSTSFVGDIKSMRSNITSTQDFLRSMVSVYNKCLISESNSRRLIFIFENKSGEKAEKVNNKLQSNNTCESNEEARADISELCNDSEYSNMIPNVIMNLKALILDLEYKRNQIADEITSTLIEKINSNSPSEFFDQLEEEGLFENKCFLDSADILMNYHKELYGSLLFNIMESRSKYLEHRFNNIIGQGISVNNIGIDINGNHLSNILEYLSSLFEWITVCGISVEVEFLTKALYYEHNDNCVFEQNFEQNCGNIYSTFKNMKTKDEIDYFSRNFLNIITSILCIPFSGAIRDILRQFHPPQTSRPDSIHHFGNLTALKTGITIGIKVAHLIDNYIHKITPMFKLLPKYNENNSYTLSTPLLIQKFKDLKEEAIAQYFVYAELVKENILRRIDDIITEDLSISLLVMEWSTLLRDILYTMENDYIDDSDNLNNSQVNPTLSSMLDSFISPMLNVICSVSVSQKKTPLISIIKINNIKYLCNNMLNHNKMLKYIGKHIDIINKVVDDEKSQLIEFVTGEFNSKYRFKELLSELSSKDSSQADAFASDHNSDLHKGGSGEKTREESEQEPLIKLSQVILDQFFDTILRFGTVPFPNVERIQDKTIKKEILTHIYSYITKQYGHICEKVNNISPTKKHLLKYDEGEINLIFDNVINKL
ncbi:hypothetical protein FG386_000635 [Cryptosporidium ryanae]|uniref:uncharacterized protein n=1 Tax=Cryptosporidium ryanae TaxID=515981 RepID=UPI00351AA336|nr:hypothetical protein FG386_000635 [Cryptosporidium ryanae]